MKISYFDATHPAWNDRPLKKSKSYYAEVELSPQTANKIFIIFCFIHLLAWTLGPILFRLNLHLDGVEEIGWGNQWQLGYPKHPPLAAWLSACVTYFFDSPAWPLYLLAQSCVIMTFNNTWRLANKVLSPPLALISILSLEGILYFNNIATNFNPNILMLPIWSLATLIFYNALTRQKLVDWIALGIVAGFAMLTKYESILLFFTMGILFCISYEAREQFKKPGVYVAVILGALIWLPNIIWIITHNYLPISYIFSRTFATSLSAPISHFYYPLRFTIDQLAYLFCFFLMLAPFYFTKKKPFALTRLQQQFFIIMGISPLLCTILLSLLTGMYMRGSWGIPFFSLSGLLAMLWLQPSITSSLFKRFLWLASFIFLSIWLISVEITWNAHNTKLHHPAYRNVYYLPWQRIANVAMKKWYSFYSTPPKYIAGTYDVIYYLSAYTKNPRLIPYPEWNQQISPWIKENDVRKNGAIFTWIITKNDNECLPAPIQERFPAAKVVSVENFYPFNANSDPLKIGIALLPPSQ